MFYIAGVITSIVLLELLQKSTLSNQWMGGQVGQPHILPPICMEGVGTRTVVEERERGGRGER